MKTRFGWWLFLLPLLWIGGSAHTPHPFYVSVTEITHNAGEKSLEVTCKVFADDMEDALKKQARTTVNLSSAAQHQQAAGLMGQYVQRHLQVLVNGRPVTLKFLGFEKESESVFCYLEGENIAGVKKLEVVNSLLHDFTAEQINIMHVTVGGKRQSTKLTFPATAAHFNF